MTLTDTPPIPEDLKIYGSYADKTRQTLMNSIYKDCISSFIYTVEWIMVNI